MKDPEEEIESSVPPLRKRRVGDSLTQPEEEAQVPVPPPARRNARKSRSKDEEEDDQTTADAGGDQDDVEAEDEEEEEEESTQSSAVRKRQALKASSGNSAETGVIEQLDLTNFMCHTKFTIKLCPNINFIIGENGSMSFPLTFFSPSSQKSDFY